MTDQWEPRWEYLIAEDGKVHVQNGWLIRRTYRVGQPGETVERAIEGPAQ